MISGILALALNLQGGWLKPCEELPGETYVTQELSISGDQWVRRTHANRDRNCRGVEYLEIQEVFTATVKGANLDLKTTSVSYTPRTFEETAILNAMMFCDREDWEINKTQEVTGLVCSGYQIAQRDQMRYSIWQLQKNSGKSLLWLGENTPNADGSVPEKRNLVFELFAFERPDEQGQR